MFLALRDGLPWLSLLRDPWFSSLHGFSAPAEPVGNFSFPQLSPTVFSGPLPPAEVHPAAAQMDRWMSEPMDRHIMYGKLIKLIILSMLRHYNIIYNYCEQCYVLIVSLNLCTFSFTLFLCLETATQNYGPEICVVMPVFLQVPWDRNHTFNSIPKQLNKVSSSSLSTHYG